MMPGVDLRLGDCLEHLPGLPRDGVIVSDPPYGMKWDTDSTRFSGGDPAKVNRAARQARGLIEGRSDWGDIKADSQPFDPAPWLDFPKVILWGANHYAARLPVGTTLVWLKKGDHLFGTFLSDAEVGWQKGGHGVYCHRKNFPPPCRMQEGHGKVAHPTQKPLALMRWCIERLKLKPGTTIIDPYMGSGTTGVAAVQLGFDFIGIELDPTHLATAQRRIDAALNATPLFA